MPGGTVNYQTFASAAVGGDDEFRWFATNVNPALLRIGTNVLAVEIHQNTNNSSDLGFDLELVGQIDEAAPPRITVSMSNDQLALTWRVPLDPFDLEGCSTIDGSWQPVPETVLVSENTAHVAISPLAPERFYRLVRR